MKTKSLSLWNIPLVGIVLMVLAGCGAERPPVPVPPVFNLYAYQRLAVVPFQNASTDPALGKAVQDEMTDEIVNLGALPVIDGVQVAAYLKGGKSDGSDILMNEGLRKKIAQKFKCDVLLVGSADGYRETLKDEAPKRGSNPDTGATEWGFFTDRKVVVNASAKLIDPVSGALLWTQKNQGWSWHNTWNPLPVPGDVAVPEQLNQFLNLANLVTNRINHKTDDEPAVMDEHTGGDLIYPKSRAFAGLRDKAVQATMNGIVEDFRGHSGWAPQVK